MQRAEWSEKVEAVKQHWNHANTATDIRVEGNEIVELLSDLAMVESCSGIFKSSLRTWGIQTSTVTEELVDKKRTWVSDKINLHSNLKIPRIKPSCQLALRSLWSKHEKFAFGSAFCLRFRNSSALHDDIYIKQSAPHILFPSRDCCRGASCCFLIP